MMRGRRARRDDDSARSRPKGRGRAQDPASGISPDAPRQTGNTGQRGKTRDPVASQPPAAAEEQAAAADEVADQLQPDAEQLAAAQRFRHRIERELPAELRTRLHLTVAGTAATFVWHDRSYTLTYGGFVERTRTTPSGGLAAYTLRAWCLTPADNQQGVRNVAEGELQASLFEYLGIHGSH